MKKILPSGTRRKKLTIILSLMFMVLLISSIYTFSASSSALAQNSTSTADDQQDNGTSNEHDQSQSSDTASDGNATDTSDSGQDYENNDNSNNVTSTGTTSNDNNSISAQSQDSGNSTATSGTDSYNASGNSTSASNGDDQGVQPSQEESLSSTNSTNNSSSNSTGSVSETSDQENQSSLSSNSTDIGATPSPDVNSTSTITELGNMTQIVRDQNATDAIATLVTISGEPLVPSEVAITRSFTFSSLEFESESLSEVSATIAWHVDGTVDFSDSRGYHYSLEIPASNGAFVLLHNSTTIDQKLITEQMQYDIYWWPVKNSADIVDKYKFAIAGMSSNGSIVSLKVSADSGSRLKYDGQHFLITEMPSASGSNANETYDIAQADNATLQLSNASSTINVAPIPDDETFDLPGIGIDWSDAIDAGYPVTFDAEKLSINVQVGETFLIDPTTVIVVNTKISPDRGDPFEGENRIISTFNSTKSRINVFFIAENSDPNPGTIKYRTSDDGGKTWSSSSSTGSGTPDGDWYRWTVIPGAINGTNYVFLFYPDEVGADINLYSIRGVVNNNLTITWGSITQVYSTTLPTAQTCNACAGVSAAVDSKGIIYAAFSYLRSSSSTETFHYIIQKSSDSGATWTTSLTRTNTGAPYNAKRLPVVIAAMDSSKMLAAYQRYDSADLFYRIFNGTSWGSVQTLTGVGQASAVKQISAAGDVSTYTYIAFLGSSSLKAARFLSNGTYQAVETIDNTMSYSLPNILFDNSKNPTIVAVSASPYEIYQTRKINDVWESPAMTFGSAPNNVDILTGSSLHSGEVAIFYKDGASNTQPFTMKFDVLEAGTVLREYDTQNSPSSSDYFEGERRVVSNQNGTLFAFYYDNSNIVYRRSFDGGNTWSSSATSTGTGAISSDNFRWSIAYINYNGTDTVSLLYYALSGANTNFYQKSFKALDSGLILISTVSTFSVANDPSCSPAGVCAAAAGASDGNRTLFAAYTYKTGGIWYHRVVKSSDGGVTWSSSTGPGSQPNTSNHVPITITRLDTGKMLLTWARYETANLSYKVFDGSNWGGTVTLTGIGWKANATKQISSGTVDSSSLNDTSIAYVAYVSNGSSGSLKVASFFGNGTFRGSETADSTLSHQLPSISVTTDDTVHVYSLNNNIIYDTQRNITGWQQPIAPYGEYFDSPDQLTSLISNKYGSAVLWRSGISSPHSFFYAGKNTRTVEEKLAYINSPKSSDSYEGEKRLIRLSNTTLFAFYYDGQNIRYKYSNDSGLSWEKPLSVGTGKINGEYYRWTVASTKIGSTHNVFVLYYSQSGSNTVFWAKRGQISGSDISWQSAVQLLSVTNNSLCGTSNACTAISASNDTSGNIYVALRWLDTTNVYKYQINKYTTSSNAWSVSLSTSSTSSSKPVSIVITGLSSDKMLLSYLRYDTTSIYYRIFNGSSWQAEQTLGSTGMINNAKRQASIASDSNGRAYLTYVTGGTYGNLMIVNWTNSGTSPQIATADSGISHSLPSVIVTAGNQVHIYTMSHGDLYFTSELRVNDTRVWNIPLGLYVTENYADQLTSSISIQKDHPDALWTEGSSEYKIRVNGFGYRVVNHFCLLVLLDLTHQCENQATDFTIPGDQVSAFNSKLYFKTPLGPMMDDICEAVDGCVTFIYHLEWPTSLARKVLFSNFQMYSFRSGSFAAYAFKLYPAEFGSQVKPTLFDIEICSSFTCKADIKVEQMPVADSAVHDARLFYERKGEDFLIQHVVFASPGYNSAS